MNPIGTSHSVKHCGITIASKSVLVEIIKAEKNIKKANNFLKKFGLKMIISGCENMFKFESFKNIAIKMTAVKSSMNGYNFEIEF